MDIDLHEVALIVDLVLIAGAIFWSVLGGIRSIHSKKYTKEMTVNDCKSMDTVYFNKRESAKIAIRFTWLFIVFWLILTMSLLILQRIDFIYL